MTDPGLGARLAGVRVPTLVVWGEADRIADPDYGRAYAAAIPGARFALLRGTGHVPQVETPQLLISALDAVLPAQPASPRMRQASVTSSTSRSGPISASRAITSGNPS
jgi:hypothetical protein